MRLHFNPQPKLTPKLKNGKKPIQRKARFREQANPTKVYKAKRIPESVRAFAEQCRRERIANPTPAEDECERLLKEIPVSYEREKIFTYANGQRFILVDFIITGSNGRMYAIELDGLSHLLQNTYDKGRDSWLATQGIATLRFFNKEILKTPPLVLAKVKELLG